MWQMQISLVIISSLLLMVANTRTTGEFNPTVGVACGTVKAIQVLVNPTQDQIDNGNGCTYIKHEISSFPAPAKNLTISNSTAVPWTE